MHIKKILTTMAVISAMAGLLVACGGAGGGSGSPVATSGTPGSADVTAAPAKPLEVVGSDMVNGTGGVGLQMHFSFNFNADLKVSSFSSDKVLLSDGVKTYPVKLDVVGRMLTVSPVDELRSNTDYHITIKTGVSSADGGALGSDYIFTFKTTLGVYEFQQVAPPDLTVYGHGMPRIIIADINGDGRPDLVELAALNCPGFCNGYTINIYLQNAAKGFDKFQKLDFLADVGPYSKYFNNLIALDIDGDNKPELLVPEYRADDPVASGIRVFKAGNDGKFSTHEFISTSYTETLQAFDVDGDGKTDLVGSDRRAIDQITGGFQVLLNTANGLKKLPPVVLPNSNYEFGIADLDQDGKRELIVNRMFMKPGNGPLVNELLIYSQDSPGVFSLNAGLTKETAGFCAGADYCREMKIADLNGDGQPELVFGANTLLGEVSTRNVTMVFSRQPGGGLIKRNQVSLGAASVFGIQDMNADGIPDLLVVGAGDGRGAFFSIVGGGPNFSLQFSNQIFPSVPDMMNPGNVAIGDVDGDGKPDVVFDSYNGGIIMARYVK